MPARHSREDRREKLLAVALKLSAKNGYQVVTRGQIAEAAGVAPSLVSYCLGDMDTLRTAVMRAAIAGGNLRILAQGLARGDATARRAPDALKTAAGATLGRS